MAVFALLGNRGVRVPHLCVTIFGEYPFQVGLNGSQMAITILGVPHFDTFPDELCGSETPTRREIQQEIKLVSWVCGNPISCRISWLVSMSDA